MLDSVRTKIDQTKEFVKKHPTLTAIVITGVVTHKVTYDRTLRGAIAGATDTVTSLGFENGVLTMQNSALREFIIEKGLNEEYGNFVDRLTESY